MRRLLALIVLALVGCSSGVVAESVPPSGSSGSASELNSALLAAAYVNDVATASRLIADGADVNHKDGSVQSAYLIATSEVGDDPRLLDLCLANGAKVDDLDSYNGTGLIRAAHRGYPVIVARLVAADIPLDHINRLGWTALLEAVILGNGGSAHQQVVRVLLDAGADASIKDFQGMTALDHARQRGQQAIVELLDR